MSGVTRIVVLACLCCLYYGTVVAQQRTIKLDTNWPEARVYADSTLLGKASQKFFSLPSGITLLRLVPPEHQAGSIEPLQTDVTQLRDSAEVKLYFPYHYRIETVPFDASVIVESAGIREKLGVTPLVISFPGPLKESEFIIERSGYLDERIDPGQEIWNVYSLVLKPVISGSVATNEVSWKPPAKRHKWIDYTAIGLAVASGLVTVHYKFKADNRYDLYRETGEESLRKEVKRYDTRAAVALAGMQVGVGVFALRLVLR